MDEHANCDETVKELYGFLDGELTDERRLHIREHLDGCPPCFEAFDFEAELREVIANRCRDQVPVELKNKIAALIAGEGGADT